MAMKWFANRPLGLCNKAKRKLEVAWTQRKTAKAKGKLNMPSAVDKVTKAAT
jgi:hypothetical protein